MTKTLTAEEATLTQFAGYLSTLGLLDPEGKGMVDVYEWQDILAKYLAILEAERTE